MEPIRTLICDDEPDAREGLSELLRGDPEVVVVGQARSGREAVALVEEMRPELVFLDVQMPGLDGFGVVQAVGAERAPVVVFVTAYDEYALRAFEVHALDYLLKPFSDARFADALRLAKARVRQRRAGELVPELAALLGDERRTPGAAAPAPAAARPLYLDRITVRTGNQVYFVRVDDIDWIEADDYYAKLHVAGRTHLVRETMQRLASKLDPRRFVRVHRSAIVNLERVQRLQPYFRGAHVLTLNDGTRLTLSRSRRAQFERALGSRL
jgi:two-component system LytT family response regulator